jgi:hypothetical protein
MTRGANRGGAGSPAHTRFARDVRSATATAQTGKRPFVFPMRAGHFYRIEVLTQVQTSISGCLEIKGFETDAAG